ncbi:MAG: hypothetical protein LBJ98_02280 [Endomicrobium sp.]|jgi:hypothetical protein|nr:hypothetical protein [Endomicrobium sp.]
MSKQLHLNINGNSQSIWGRDIDETNVNPIFRRFFEAEKFDTRDYLSIVFGKENKREGVKEFINSYYYDNLFLLDDIDFVLPNLEKKVSISTNSSSKNDVISENYKFLLREQEFTFVQMLKETEFVDGMDNRVTEYFANLLTKHKNDALLWIQDVFLQNINNEDIVIKILSLFMDYSYDDLYPASQMIALASKEHKSTAVKSVAFSLFGHWCSKESLELLEAYNEPQEFWLKMKYDTLKTVIRKRCGM